MLLAAGLLAVLVGGVLGIGVYDRWSTRVMPKPSIAHPPRPRCWQRPDDRLRLRHRFVGRCARHLKDRLGMTHTGLVTAPEGLDAGSTVPIWIDRSGAAVPEPMSARDALGMAGITAGLVIVAGVMVLAVVWVILGRVLMASNSAAWEQEWRQVAPLWSRGEGRRG